MKKLLGKNDIEDSLKRLDTLTQEEARMAIVEVLRGAQLKAWFSGHSGCPDSCARIWLDGKETKGIVGEVYSALSIPIFAAVSSRGSITPKENQSRQDIRKWLSPPDPSTNHNTARSIQHEVTATWFFEGSMYNTWKTSPSLLWIHGKRASLSSSATLYFLDSCPCSRFRQDHSMVRGFSSLTAWDNRNCRLALR